MEGAGRVLSAWMRRKVCSEGVAMVVQVVAAASGSCRRGREGGLKRRVTRQYRGGGEGQVQSRRGLTTQPLALGDAQASAEESHQGLHQRAAKGLPESVRVEGLEKPWRWLADHRGRDIGGWSWDL